MPPLLIMQFSSLTPNPETLTTLQEISLCECTEIHKIILSKNARVSQSMYLFLFVGGYLSLMGLAQRPDIFKVE